MRLHHLEVTGFGPFADPARIDFDALSDAGLFLLSGPTGAGKSSVLDAVCFALYGDVPGDRATAKRLRSDHAGDDVVPRVVLEATLSGRRFRIDRSPAWRRPKKRGTGTTTEQARVVISERRRDPDGTDAWHPLSTRLDETGHLVTRLVGMTLPQFCQVALLPQGRFQAFLRARSEERHALLQQVFRTERFDQVERWLRERRVELRRASDDHRATLADLASRVSEVSGDPAPDDWPDIPDLLLDWAHALARTTAGRAASEAEVVEATAASERVAADAAAAGTELAGRRAEHAAAERDLAGLLHAADEHQRDVASIEAAERALAVRPVQEVALSARAAEDGAARGLATLRRDLARVVDASDGVEPDDHQVAELQRAAVGALTELARVRPLRDEADALAADLARLERERATAATRSEGLAARAAELPALLDDLAPRLARATDAVALVPALEHELAALDVRLRAAVGVEELTLDLEAAEQEQRAAASARLVAREALVEIREQRLDGMAAEIASRLAVGGCCPVCGSAEHPSPAAPAPGAPDEAAERAARRRVDDLEVEVEAHAQKVRGLEARRATAAVEAGGTRDELTADRDDRRARLADARAVAAEAPVLERRVAALHDDLAATSDELDRLDAEAARLATEVAVTGARLDDLRDRVRDVLPDDADLDALVAHHRRVDDLATRLLAAAGDLDRARVATRRAEAAAADAAGQHGFGSADEAAAAWLAPEALAALRRRVEQHAHDLDRARTRLADPTLVSAAAAPAPDLEALARELHRARADAQAARQREARLRDRAARLAGLADDVEAALAAWQPLLADLDVVARLAATVEGKHADNQLQMRLSAYVLAHRLGQVVEAANLRLSTMSDRRYSLVHTGRRGAGETRGGLSLLVRDDWTGDSRDPATLSGGETFVVSLALALGLADVITAEAGGADLDTLFVDEGFGSLDADTLEDVMDTLDTLRDGGRVVGVVSHVPELQTRIPTQLRVHRGRHGSRVSLRVG